MMRRETLEGYRRVVAKFDYRPSAERERQLIDSHLEALNRIAELTAAPEIGDELREQIHILHTVARNMQRHIGILERDRTNLATELERAQRTCPHDCSYCHDEDCPCENCGHGR